MRRSLNPPFPVCVCLPSKIPQGGLYAAASLSAMRRRRMQAEEGDDNEPVTDEDIFNVRSARRRLLPRLAPVVCGSSSLGRRLFLPLTPAPPHTHTHTTTH